MKKKQLNELEDKIIKLSFSRNELDKFAIYINGNIDLIYERIIEIISIGIKLKLESVDIFEFKRPKDILIFKRNEWMGFFERALSFFLKKENYLVCEKIKQSLDLLQKQKNKKLQRK